VDWPAFYSALKTNVAADRMKAISALRTQFQADRGHTPQVTFDWNGETLDTKEQLEGGLKQMTEGFFQAYWSMLASPLVKSPSEFTKIEPLADGSSQIYESSGDIKLVFTADKDGLPVHYVFDGSAFKGTIDAQFAPSPKPTEGDMRRISSLILLEQIGDTKMNVKLSLDYQAVGGFYIPDHVLYEMIGAYTIPLEFTDCSVKGTNPKTP
jgi:hypothetical protein